jgi:hypothetical protein
MAKGILRFFGILSLFAGFGGLVLGVLSGAGALVIVPWAIAMLLAGAPMLALAMIVELLEQIERNTRR